MFVLVVVILVPEATLAKEVEVEEDSGWTIKFDYQVWTAGKEFHIGDKLVFRYPVGAHNVHKMNATGFQDCVAPLDIIPLVTSNDAITFATLGKKWYICGVGKHCEVGGQKVVITILLEVVSPVPSPQALAPTSSTKGIVSLGAHMLAAVAPVTMTFIT
ncbi:hypothetical protein GIB67_005332 [Kingdonia uniflora]|uniref:Phytocyanin domain-containing protein n=1 Tax=Kingdonia uniflora TaxID=39325 RepID=A0A7J7ND11_9MAGN|nr:hypothetical protein GIB67_005332 [Kingdonia uniflora]